MVLHWACAHARVDVGAGVKGREFFPQRNANLFAKVRDERERVGGALKSYRVHQFKKQNSIFTIFTSWERTHTVVT